MADKSMRERASQFQTVIRGMAHDDYQIHHMHQLSSISKVCTNSFFCCFERYISCHLHVKPVLNGGAFRFVEGDSTMMIGFHHIKHGKGL